MKLLGPCPIPRCALEWQLGIMMIAIGLQLGYLADVSHVRFALAVSDSYLVPQQWGLFIAAPGALQVGALLTKNRLLHRWAAWLVAMVSLMMANVLYAEHTLPILGAVFLVQFGGAAYVCLMLRGAQWSWSKSYSGA